MKVSRITKPPLAQLFENLLWSNSPSHWIFKTTYFHKTLFVSVLVKMPASGKDKKIRRSFSIDLLNSRIEDLHGLASDCIDEMKNSK